MAISGFKQTSDILTLINLFRDSKMTGSTWKEIFKVLSAGREQWVPELEDSLMYTVKDISLVTTDFAAAEANSGSGMVAYL